MLRDKEGIREQLAKVIRPEIEPGRRVIAVSDIHGNLPFLKGLLDKVGFSKEDVLILVGDLLEKGTESLAVLRYLLQLQQTHTVYSLSGNCDHIDRVFLEDRPGVDHDLWPVFQFWKGRSLILQMGAEIGMEPRCEEDLPALRRALLEHFPRETGFIMSLPHILEAGNFLFVHGGVPREDRLEELVANDVMKNDDFMGQGLSFSKWIVVGHWPVTLYDPKIPSARPLVDHQRRIASIDGGCVLKVDGQLNALIIPDVYGWDIGYRAYDGLPVMTALDDQPESEDPFNIRWSDSAVEVLREEDDCCWCRHLSSGREMWILKEYLYPRKSDGLLHCEDSTDYCPPVKAGERLAVVRKCSRGTLIKRHGVTGWYLGRLADTNEAVKEKYYGNPL